jgi:hypothetical protein
MLITSAVNPATHMSLAGIVLSVASIAAGPTVAIVKIRTDRPTDVRDAETWRMMARRFKDPERASVFYTLGKIATSCHTATAKAQENSVRSMQQMIESREEARQATPSPAMTSDKPLHVVRKRQDANEDGLRITVFSQLVRTATCDGKGPGIGWGTRQRAAMAFERPSRRLSTTSTARRQQSIAWWPRMISLSCTSR